MLNEKIDVLDKGFVRLVDCMGDDLSISRAARVSYAAAWRSGEDKNSDVRLIRYLLRNKHTSPFEAVQLNFEVKAPIFVFRQWHRHRTWSYNELSARYRELPEEFYVPRAEDIGTQSKDNKQVREIDTTTSTDVQTFLQSVEIDYYRYTCLAAFKEYEGLLKRGWPRELARMVLPLSTYSHMFASVNLHNLLHFIRLRDHDHAQYEIRVYAQAMRKILEDIVPFTMDAFNETEKEKESEGG